MADSRRLIRSLEELEALYEQPSQRALAKELRELSSHYRAFVEKAPFVVVATAGPGGLDCSPRGDAPGFVRVVDSRTLQLPDRRGNNRLDTLRNLLEDDRISLLFLVPGVGETLRVNGRAVIDADPGLCASFAVQGKPPRSVVTITIERVYFQCQKALVRGRLWDGDAQISRKELPTAGQMLEQVTGGELDGAHYDREYPEHMKRTIY